MAASDSEALSIITDHVQQRYYTEDAETWRQLPEIPDKSEIMRHELESATEPEPWNEYQHDPIYDCNLPQNTVKGPWESKSNYVSAHYQILREDAIAGLRQSVQTFRANPEMKDGEDICIYTSVHFKGLQLAAIGAGFCVEFSHERAGKQIRWAQSKRLVQGTMVALSPEKDAFRTICKICVVAARPLENGVELNPPRIDLFWGKPEEAEFDPNEPYIMIESRSSYFEASRHMLVALQKLETERFQLSNHLVGLDRDIQPSEYLKEHPFMDLRSLAGRTEDPEESESVDGLHNVNVLKHFPKVAKSGMDMSQMLACERMVTKRVAIVQGPPGTGKTFTSVSALRVMVENLSPDDPPIIIAAQTNHAVDQLLNHIMKFEPNILRLGGRSDKENEEILKRTLYELRTNTQSLPKSITGGIRSAYGHLKTRVEEVKAIMAPILRNEILTAESLLKDKIITQKHFDSLNSDDGWAGQGGTDSDQEDLISNWVNDQLVPIKSAPPINDGLPMEESDLEFEQLQELEGEAGDATLAENDKEALRGDWLPFKRRFTGKHFQSPNLRAVKRCLDSHQDLYSIPVGKRGEIYRYFEILQNKRIKHELHSILKEYQDTVKHIRIAKWHSNTRLVKHLGIKLIGCTTTGLSKYRGFLAAFKPRTLLIEEAAETLEGTIMAGMFESLQQLILVGDHKQLQAHCNVPALENAPYYMNISMFERLVNNSIQFTMLNEQRRMIPEVRKLLCVEPTPFYKNLKDHPSVLDPTNRPPIPGMGSLATYFFHHNWPEGKNSDSSRYNSDEAEMIAKFFLYLTMNGIKQEKITILTFYNGQRKTILRELKKGGSSGSAASYFNVFTVDSYQGEENDVILLSLVRSNQYLGIGFLENRTRLVVALSRARRGLYIFGNAITLVSAESSEQNEILGRESLWNPIVEYMKKQGRFDLDGGLPITCTNHRTTLRLYEPDQWVGNYGGCNRKCGDLLPCGHPCLYNCHPFEHSRIVCSVPCPGTLSCGHGCSRVCGEVCECDRCEPLLDAEPLGSCDMEHYRDILVSSPKRPANLGSGRGSEQRRAVSSPKKLTSKSTKRGSFPSSDVRSDLATKGCPLDVRGRGKRDVTPKPSPQKRSNRNQRRTGKEGSSQHEWKGWNAAKADKDLKEKTSKLEAKQPKLDPSTIVYKEVHRPVIVKNGVRVVTAGIQRVVPRTELPPLVDLNSGESAAEEAAPKCLLKPPRSFPVLKQLIPEQAQPEEVAPKFPLKPSSSVPALKQLIPELAEVEVASLIHEIESSSINLLPYSRHNAGQACVICHARKTEQSDPYAFKECRSCQRMFCYICVEDCNCKAAKIENDADFHAAMLLSDFDLYEPVSPTTGDDEASKPVFIGSERARLVLAEIDGVFGRDGSCLVDTSGSEVFSTPQSTPPTLAFSLIDLQDESFGLEKEVNERMRLEPDMVKQDSEVEKETSTIKEQITGDLISFE